MGNVASTAGPANPWSRYGIEHPPEHPLRLGLVVDDPAALARWAAECVQRLVESGVAELVLVGQYSHRQRPSAAGRGRPAHLPYRLARATFWRSPLEAPVRVGALLRDVANVRLVPTPANPGAAGVGPGLEPVFGARLDVLLNLSSQTIGKELADLPRFGAWVVLHGAEQPGRGRPTGFWKLHRGVSELEVTLHRYGGVSGAGQILQRAIVGVDKGSYRGTLDRAYHVGVDLPLLACRDLVAGLAVHLESVASAVPPGPVPGPGAVARVIVSSGIARLKRLAYGAFMLKQWSVGRLTGGADRVLSGQLDGVRWLQPAGRTRFLADPVIVPGTGGRVILCEDMDYAVGRGTIVRVEVGEDDGMSRRPIVGQSRSVLALGIHLSFPTVVSTDAGMLLVPEAAGSGGLLTARLDDHATATLDLEYAPGLAAADPVVFRHADRWWLACSEQGPTAQTHLWLFHGPGPRGPWQAHARNPVVIDVGSARSAGIPFVHDGVLYRPAQDSRAGYGSAIRLMRVRNLSPVDYAEDVAVEIGPDPSGPFGRGIHTVSVDRDAIWIDGYRTIVHPLAGWYRLRARRRPDSVNLNVSTGWMA